MFSNVCIPSQLIGIGGLTASVVAINGFLADLDLLGHYEDINVYILCGGSVLSLLLGITAIFALARKSYGGILANEVFSIVLLIAIIAFVITVPVTSNYTKKGSLYKTMKQEIRENKLSYLIKLQTTLSCCGVDGSEDYKTIPQSCYKTKERSYAFPIGCFTPLKRLLIYNGSIVVAVILLVAIVDIIIITLSQLLCAIILREKFNENSVESGMEISSDCPTVEMKEVTSEEDTKTEVNETKTEVNETKSEVIEKVSDSNQNPNIPVPPPMPRLAYSLAVKFKASDH